MQNLRRIPNIKYSQKVQFILSMCRNNKRIVTEYTNVSKCSEYFTKMTSEQAVYISADRGPRRKAFTKVTRL